MRLCGLLFAVIFFAACSNQQPKVDNKKPVPPKGELAFLLQYDGRMPSDVGFLSNHIMERRLANLMKENFQPFRKSIDKEYPLIVDTTRYIVFSKFGDNEISQYVIVDVANDAVWAGYSNLATDSVLEFTDHASLSKPVLH